MNREFIPYEQALELKELGYNLDSYSWWVAPVSTPSLLNNKGTKEPLLTFLNYTNHLSAPSYHQAFRWFRERYGLYADLFVDDDRTFGFCVSSFAEEDRCRLDKPIKRQFSTYEESELECIKFLIEIVRNK